MKKPTDFEVVRDEGWTRKESWKNHVNRND